MRNNILKFVLILLSMLGITDASYLSYSYFSGIPVKCSFFSGCEIVTASKYSEIFGIPISLIGLLYYILLFVIIVWATRKEEISISGIKNVFLLSFFGFLFSAYLLYLQVFIIQTLCIFCLISATVSTLIFVLSGLFYKSLRGNTQNLA